MGVTRRIDFILFSKQFGLMESRACNKFELCSDHRAVYAQLSFETCGHVKRARYVQAKRAWKPELDENNTPHDYHAALSQSLWDRRPDSISELEEIVKIAVVTRAVPTLRTKCCV